MKGPNSPHIFAPAPSYRTDACSGVARSKAADERCVMADVLDFRQEAKGCLHLRPGLIAVNMRQQSLYTRYQLLAGSAAAAA